MPLKEQGSVYLHSLQKILIPPLQSCLLAHFSPIHVPPLCFSFPNKLKMVYSRICKLQMEIRKILISSICIFYSDNLLKDGTMELGMLDVLIKLLSTSVLKRV